MQILTLKNIFTEKLTKQHEPLCKPEWSHILWNG